MGCCASDTEINSLVEKFHCYPDKHFINYIENKLALYSNNNKIDYSKLNEPINIVSIKQIFIF